MTALYPMLLPDDVPQGFLHERADARSNMFVMATLYGEAGSTPVRIRNMSRRGALVEGASIPREQSAVRLDRGSLSARGHIVWCREGRAGIKFDTSVNVASWLPRTRRPGHQQRVDEMVEACRAASGGLADETAAPSPISQAETIRHLLDLRDTLQSVAEELASNETVTSGHATALQEIDVAAQKLDKIASWLANPR